jgi:hypothetical protein
MIEAIYLSWSGHEKLNFRSNWIATHQKQIVQFQSLTDEIQDQVAKQKVSNDS